MISWFSKKESEKPTGGDIDPPEGEAAATAPSAGTAAPEEEEYAVMPKELRIAIAGLKGTAPVQDNEVEKVPMSEVFPISAALAKEERRKEAARQKAEAEALKNPQPGQMIAGQGVFLGQYTPKDRAGKNLGKTFNAFASPEDLTNKSGKKETYKYVDAVKRIAELKDWNGFDGTNYATDKELYKALKDGTYTGGWIIPTRELLIGTEPDGESGVRKGKVIQPDNLYDHRNKGALKDTFCTKAASGSDYPQWYWSCTENRGNPSDVWNADFSDGNEDWYLKDFIRLSCRPVRLLAI